MACFFVYFDSFISQLCTKLKERKGEGEREGRAEREREERREATERLNLTKDQFKFASGYKTVSQWKIGIDMDNASSLKELLHSRFLSP